MGPWCPREANYALRSEIIPVIECAEHPETDETRKSAVLYVLFQHTARACRFGRKRCRSYIGTEGYVPPESTSFKRNTHAFRAPLAPPFRGLVPLKNPGYRVHVRRHVAIPAMKDRQSLISLATFNRGSGVMNFSPQDRNIVREVQFRSIPTTAALPIRPSGALASTMSKSKSHAWKTLSVGSGKSQIFREWLGKDPRECCESPGGGSASMPRFVPARWAEILDDFILN
jgi:hypothetical protein